MAITYIINFQSNFSGTDYMRKGEKKKKKQQSGFKANYGSLIIAIKLIEYKILMIYAE